MGVFRLTGRSLLALVVSVAMSMAFALAALGEDLRWTSDITYEANVDGGNLQVSAEMTLTNLKPNRVTDEGVTSYYYEGVEFFVPENVENVVATSGGRTLNVILTTEPGEDFAEVKRLALSFGRRLNYEQSITVVVQYDIPGEAPRSETPFRVNPAYVSFGAWGWGDPGRITVNVVVPNTFDVNVDQPFSEKVLGSDVYTYIFSEIDDPADFYVYVQARDDEALTRDVADLAEYDVIVRSWPDDLSWNNDVISAVEAGLPELQKLVGLPWRPESTLQIVESQEVNLAGYGGWYLEGDETIEIGEWVDPHLVLHELSHTWFNGALFDSRWINEGLADEFAAEAVENAGLDTTLYPRLESAPTRGSFAVALNDWEVPDFGSEDFDQYEAYGYDASFWVVQEIADEIGHVAFAEVLEAAANDQIAYVGAGAPETVGTIDDWRRFLDLLQERGGSVAAEHIFTEFVTDLDLAARSAARESYAALLTKGDGWRAPIYIREPLGLWDFATAESRIDEAVQVLRLRDDIVAASGIVAAAAPASLQTEYEMAAETLASAEALGTSQLDTINVIVDAKAAVDEEPDLLEAIGLIGEDLDKELGEAVSDFEADSLEKSVSGAKQVLAIVAAAGIEGRNRLLIGLGAVVVLTFIIWLLVRRRRRRRTLAPMAEVGADFAPGGES